jgi:hypothetical protein
MPTERPSVRLTVDFQRIERLPRRKLNDIDADAWAAVYTDELRAPGSGSALRRWQGPCFAEAVECRGGFYVLPVGFGKTILTRYLGLVLEAERVLLIVPANLRDKTRADFRSYIGKWRTDRPPPLIMSREELALEKNAKFLETFQPQVIVIDESDELANYEASAVRRLDRYIMARTREQCAVFCLSGTPTRNSIMGYWHLLRWCLRDDAPVPKLRSEARMWAAALDQQKTENDDGRMGPGPLGPTRKAALLWYRQRLQETPGVIIIDGDSAVKKDGTAIELRLHIRLAHECAALDKAFHDFSGADGLGQRMPDGRIVAAPLERWRNEGFLGCGLYPRYVKPGPPPEWRAERARRSQAFAKLCRETIRKSSSWRDPKDTEAQVRKLHRGNPILLEWDEYADDPYAKETVWVSNATIQTAIDYLAEENTPAIIWTGCVEFGKELARVLGCSYFSRDGKDQYRNDLDAISRLPDWHKRSFVCSWHANKKGFNLQPWLRHGVFNPPTSAKWIEQLTGRAHRADVDEGGVTFTFFATSGGTLDAIDAAVAEAGFAKQSVGPTQKILRAKFKRERPKRTERNKFRWARG